jgi:hypothetical protein
MSEANERWIDDSKGVMMALLEAQAGEIERLARRCRGKLLRAQLRGMIERQDAIIERLTDLVPHWQPIDTAPRDGTRVLMCGPLDRMAVGWFNDDCDGRAMWDWDADGVPTDWMPLPAPPQRDEKC